jgi:hypothetical protein
MLSSVSNEQKRDGYSKAFVDSFAQSYNEAIFQVY